MMIFGILTIYNVRDRIRRVAPINQRNSHHHRRHTEGQLVRMLIVQVTAYVFFSIPTGVTNILTTFIPSMNTNYMINIQGITLLWQQGFYILSTFLYVLSGSVYREEFKKIFKFNYYREQLLQRFTGRY
ncbi:hypothetical protein I4U23_005307 [Adineta vaga]|nr:hypothetical protein I4U23_005307 [Adineta vaga]